MPEVEEKKPLTVLLDIDGTLINSQTINSQTINSQTINSQTLQDNMPLMTTIEYLQKEQGARCYISTARTAAQVFNLVKMQLSPKPDESNTKESVKHNIEYITTHKFLERSHQIIKPQLVLTKGDYVMEHKIGGSYYEKLLKPFEERLISFFIEWVSNYENPVEQLDGDIQTLFPVPVVNTIEEGYTITVQKLLQKDPSNQAVKDLIDELLKTIGTLDTPEEYSDEGLQEYLKKLNDHSAACDALIQQKTITLDEDSKNQLSTSSMRMRNEKQGINDFQKLKLLLTHKKFPQDPGDENYEKFLRIEWKALNHIDHEDNTKLAQALRVGSGKTEDTTFVHIDDSYRELDETLKTAKEMGLKNVTCMKATLARNEVGLSEYTGKDGPSITEAHHEQVEEEEDQHNISAGIINDCFPFYLDENTKSQLTSLTKRLIDSSPYANIDYYSFSRDANKVTFEVRVERQPSEEVSHEGAEQTPLLADAQTSSPTLHLKFTYNIQSDTWDIEQSSQSTPIENEERRKLLNGYIDAGYPPAGLERCYHRMTELQQKILNLYSKQYLTDLDLNFEELLLSGVLVDISEKAAEDIKNEMHQTMESMNELEDDVFEILTQLDQQGYLDDPQGKNIIEQLLDKKKRNEIIKNHAGKAIYNPQASTLAFLRDLRGTFAGGADSSRRDPSLWISERINLIEELLDASIKDIDKTTLNSSDKEKAEWLMGVKTLLHGIIDSKNYLITAAIQLKKRTLMDCHEIFHTEWHKFNLPRTLHKIETGESDAMDRKDGNDKIGLRAIVLHNLREARNEHLSEKEREVMNTLEQQELLTIRPDQITDDQDKILITAAKQFRCFQWKPVELDNGLQKIQRNRIYALRSIKLSSSKTPSDAMKWQVTAMIGGAVLSCVTIAVLSAGLVPAGMTLLGLSGVALWGSMVAASAIGGAIMGGLGNMLANAGSSKAKEALPNVEQPEFKAEPPPSPQSLKEELKEYTTQQLRKAFFSTVDEKCSTEIDRREAVRKEILELNAPQLFNRMFGPVVDDPQRDGDYDSQGLGRNCFKPSNFRRDPDEPLTINPANHLAHPREIASFYATPDQDDRTRRRVMAAMKKSPWIKRELAVFLVHAVLFDNATQADRDLARRLMKHKDFNDVRKALFYPSPSADEREDNEQLSFLKSFIEQIENVTDQGQLPIPSSDEESRNALLTMIKEEIQQQDQTYTDNQKLIEESHEKWKNNAFTGIDKEDLKVLLLCSCLPTEENNLYMDLQRNKHCLQINGKTIVNNETFKELSNSYQGSLSDPEKAVHDIINSNIFGLLNGDDLKSDRETKKNMLNFLLRHLSTTGNSLVASLESLIQDAFNHMQLPPRQEGSLISIPMQSSSNRSDAQYSSENSVEKTINITRKGNKLIFTTDLCYYGYSKKGDASSRYLRTAIVDGGEAEYIKLHGNKAVTATGKVTLDFSETDESGNPQLKLDETETFANVDFDTKLLEELKSPLPQDVVAEKNKFQDVVAEKNRSQKERLEDPTENQIFPEIRALSEITETLNDKIIALKKEDKEAEGVEETKGEELEAEPPIPTAGDIRTLTDELEQEYKQLIESYRDKLSDLPDDQKTQLNAIQNSVYTAKDKLTVESRLQHEMAESLASDLAKVSKHGLFKTSTGKDDGIEHDLQTSIGTVGRT